MRRLFALALACCCFFVLFAGPAAAQCSCCQGGPCSCGPACSCVPAAAPAETVQYQGHAWNKLADGRLWRWAEPGEQPTHYWTPAGPVPAGGCAGGTCGPRPFTGFAPMPFAGFGGGGCAGGCCGGCCR